MSEQPIIVKVSKPEELVPLIRYELNLRGIKQDMLAEELGISYVTTNRILNDKAPLTIETLFTILAYLGLGVILAPPKPKRNASSAEPNERKKPVKLGVSLRDLYEAGLTKLGDELVSIPGETHFKATIGHGGSILLDDGTAYTGPSTAAMALRGTTTNGWTYWGLNGRSLASLREELLAVTPE